MTILTECYIWMCIDCEIWSDIDPDSKSVLYFCKFVFNGLYKILDTWNEASVNSKIDHCFF